MKQYNAVIIGYGGMGTWHHDGILKTDRIKFTGVFDLRPERMQLAMSKGIEKSYNSLDEVLTDNSVNIVVVAVPNDFHLPIVCEALESGKSVICEKPVALNSHELKTMIETAKKTGSLFTIHQNRRADSDYLNMKTVADSGQLGKIFNIESRVMGSRGIPDGWRQYKPSGGGMLLDWGIHLIDQIMMYNKSDVISVDCTFYHVSFKEVDDGFRLILKFSDGMESLIEVGTNHYIEAPRWYVYGDRGAMVIPGWGCDGEITKTKKHDVTWEEEIIFTKAGPTKTMAPRSEDAIEHCVSKADDFYSDYDRFYRNFADVLDGKDELLVKPEEAMRVMNIVDAAFISGEKNEIIKL